MKLLKPLKEKMKEKYFWLYIGIGGLFLLFFIIFTYIVKLDFLLTFDFDTTVRLQDKTPRRFDTFYSYFSLLGSLEILTTTLVLFFILHRKFIGGTIVFSLFMFGHFLELIGKSFLEHPGPPFLFFRYDLGFVFPTSYIQPGSSYPSGHSYRTVFLTTMFVLLVVNSKKISLPLKLCMVSVILVMTTIMLVSRVTLGEHWTTDVIGGSLLGISLGVVSSLFF